MTCGTQHAHVYCHVTLVAHLHTKCTRQALRVLYWSADSAYGAVLYPSQYPSSLHSCAPQYTGIDRALMQTSVFMHCSVAGVACETGP
jgi:hypothetical protein